MTPKQKKARIKSLVSEMLKESYKSMVKKIDRVLESGAVDVESWDEHDKPMRLPKCIVTAILENESTQRDGRGTTYEKQIKKEIKNIRYFI